MAKAKVPPPPHVQAAIFRGDKKAVVGYATRGGQANARRCSIVRALNASVDEAIEEALDLDRRATLERDAYAHHMANLAGASHD